MLLGSTRGIKGLGLSDTTAGRSGNPRTSPYINLHRIVMLARD